MQQQAWCCRRHFNSHPHEEDDDGCVGTAYREKDISTHILTKRMTYGVDWNYTDSNISTHILTKRMTMPGGSRRANRSISTHILTKRMTFLYSVILQAYHISTHILTKRMTIAPITAIRKVIFQLTSSRRG